MPKLPTRLIPALGCSCILIAILGATQEAGAAGDRNGKEVVDAVCGECHVTGESNAPIIGDEEAWRTRASQGLTALTAHALEGIRQMPAHGGQPQLSDLEIARAITYMVNASGGNWVAPASAGTMMAERPGQAIVSEHCSECHESGKDGAPRIGDKAAWIPRLRQGLHYAVRSAINGHGGMPPRGGAADLTDTEIANAIAYMFEPEVGVASKASGQVKTRAVSSDPNHAIVGGTEIYLGFVPAERIRTFPADSIERSMHGGVPIGHDWYHLNVSLLDEANHTPVSDARVRVRITDGGPIVKKDLEPMAIGEGSYGRYFRMNPGKTYRVIVTVETPGSPGPIEAEFQREQ